MKGVELGLCCISLTLAEGGTRYSKMTYANFSKLGGKEALAKLSGICLKNAETLGKIAQFCANNGIKNYRIPSDIFPLLNHPSIQMKLCELPDFSEIRRRLKNAGKIFKDAGIGVSFHPSQFTVIASSKPDTRRAAADDVNLNSEILDFLGAPKDVSAPINLHINSNPDRPNFSEDFESGLALLSRSARRRLVFENEDKGHWNLKNLLEFLKPYKIPVTFDFLHHKCNNCGEPEEAAFRAAAATWGKFVPVFHYAESASKKNPRAHSDYCKNHPPYFGIPYICQLEAKAKDLAISRLKKMKGGK